jgi:hypothetical protein
MSDEYWATFSIYDHRKSLYRRSLVLFDRVVIPIPKKPIGNQTEEELDGLKADVEYLQKENAGVAFAWDSDEFYEWQKTIDGEILAGVLAKDPLFATRFLIKEELKKLVPGRLPEGVDSITPMPVYGTREKYETAVKDLEKDVAEKLTLEVILENIPVPADHVALPEIIALRKREDYQESLYALRQWQRDQVPKLLKENNDKALRQAGEDFKRLVKAYQKAMNEATYQKVTTGVCSILAIGATLAVGATPLIVAISGLAPTLFSLRSLLTPCWKQVAEKDCAPAGLVYAVSHL